MLDEKDIPANQSEVYRRTWAKRWAYQALIEERSRTIVGRQDLSFFWGVSFVGDECLHIHLLQKTDTEKEQWRTERRRFTRLWAPDRWSYTTKSPPDAVDAARQYLWKTYFPEPSSNVGLAKGRIPLSAIEAERRALIPALVELWLEPLTVSTPNFIRIRDPYVELSFGLLDDLSSILHPFRNVAVPRSRWKVEAVFDSNLKSKLVKVFLSIEDLLSLQIVKDP